MAKTVLIVEDEQSIVDILTFNLTKEGYNTIEALDGPTGLQLALEQNPDLVLLDLMLPGMSGFEVCQKVRQAGSLVPIVMLTAREEEDDKVRGLELGWPCPPPFPPPGRTALPAPRWRSGSGWMRSGPPSSRTAPPWT